MLVLLVQHAHTLSKQPAQLSNLTYTLIKEAAQTHHPHNRLIPASDIQQLLRIYTEFQLFNTNVDAAHQLLASNCLSVLLRANFSQLSHNKIYAAILLQYTKILQKLTQQIIKENNGQIYNYLKYSARGVVLSKIIFKLVQRTHSFIPQYYRFVRAVMERIQKVIASNTTSQDDTNTKATQELIIRMCFSKKVTLHCIATLLNSLWLQVQQLTTICSYTAQLQVVKELKTKYDLIKGLLPLQEKDILTTNEEQNIETKDSNIYLEQPVKVRELTPRFYDEQQSFVLNKLRKKKAKLQKRMETDLRKGVMIKQQEAQVLQDVRKERIHRQHKKELFVVEKQTAQARKFHRTTQKVKQIRKDSKGGKGDKGFKGIKGIKETKNKRNPKDSHQIGRKSKRSGK